MRLPTPAAVLSKRLVKIDCRLDELLHDLAQPLSEPDAAAGWTDEKRDCWRLHFEQLKTDLASGRVPGGAPFHLGRALDMDEIFGGPLVDRIVRFQLKLHRLFR